jgi:hypothetical protein
MLILPHETRSKPFSIRVNVLAVSVRVRNINTWTFALLEGIGRIILTGRELYGK